MQLTVIPNGPSSSDIARASPISPDFVAEYAPRPGFETRPMMDEMWMMRPQLRDFICGINARDSAMHDERFNSRISSHFSSVISSTVCGTFDPALLTRISMRPNAFSAESASLPMSPRCVMSATKYFAWTPVPFWICATACSSSFAWRLEMTTFAPASANPRAIARPRPLLPPVTSATFP
jgi:hypothetical protein